MRFPQAEPPHGDVLQNEEAHPCVACGRPVPIDRKFCSNCGSPQWEECLNCAKPVAARDRFCGACGADLHRLVDQRRREIVDDMERVEELANAMRLDEAIARCNGVAELRHPRFAKFAVNASTRLIELRDRFDRLAAEGRETLDEARSLLDRDEPLAALEKLESVPESLRGDEMTSLIEEIHRVENEVERVETVIREAIEADEMHAALDALRELLTLRPSHSQGRKLASRLCDGILESARAPLGEYDYDAAVDLLSSVPETLRGDTLSKELDRVRRLRWLTDELTLSPYVDKSLVTVAGTLLKATPKDPRVIRHCKKLKALLGELKDRTAWPRIVWGTPPESSAFGGPANPVFSIEGVEIENPTAADLLSEQADRFVSACGLALQGLRVGLVRLNLAPNAKESGGIAGLFGRRQRREVWGVDCGHNAIKAVRCTLEGDEGRRTIVVKEAVYMPYGGGFDHTLKDAVHVDLLKRTLAEFRKRHLQTDAAIAMSFSGSDTLCRNFSLPAADAKKTAQAVEFEAKHLLPGKIHQFAWKFVITNRTGGKFGLQGAEERGGLRLGRKASKGDTTDERCNIFLVAVRKDVLQRHVDILEKCGIRPEVITPDAVANINYFVHHHGHGEAGDSEGIPDESFLICDMGAIGTNLTAFSDKMITHSFVGTGGSAFTRSICRLRNMTFEQAEEFKRSAGGIDDLIALHDNWSPLADSWVNDARRRVETMLGLDAAIRNVHLIGGGFRLHGLVRHLRTDEDVDM